MGDEADYLEDVWDYFDWDNEEEDEQEDEQ